MACPYETEWCKKHVHCGACEHYEAGELTTVNPSMLADGAYAIRVPKTVARVTLCGGISFEINDMMNFTKPTAEQIKNLKETFCIDVELFD